MRYLRRMHGAETVEQLTEDQFVDVIAEPGVTAEDLALLSVGFDFNGAHYWIET